MLFDERRTLLVVYQTSKKNFANPLNVPQMLGADIFGKELWVILPDLQAGGRREAEKG